MFTLDIFNLCTPTHKNNNVLDLIITRSFETSVSDLSLHDPVLSDHFAVHCSLAIRKPPNAKLTVMTRKLCNIDSDSLCTDICFSSLYDSPSLDLPGSCQSYVINMILLFLRFLINMILYVKESSLLGFVPLGTGRKSRSRKLSVVGLKGDGVVPDSLPTINLIPTNTLL